MTIMNGRVTRPRTDTTASDRDRETKGATSPALGPTEGAYPSSPGQQQSANAAAQETLSGRIPQPIGEPELLALVVDLRLRAGRSPSRDRNGREGSRDGPTPGASGLAPANSASDTLDLCHRRIETVPEGLVGIIRDDVVR